MACVALGQAQGEVPTLLALAAASMIYVAVADRIPGPPKRTAIRATVQQVLRIAVGIGTIVLAHRIVDRFAG